MKSEALTSVDWPTCWTEFTLGFSSVQCPAWLVWPLMEVHLGSILKVKALCHKTDEPSNLTVATRGRGGGGVFTCWPRLMVRNILETSKDKQNDWKILNMICNCVKKWFLKLAQSSKDISFSLFFFLQGFSFVKGENTTRVRWVMSPQWDHFAVLWGLCSIYKSKKTKMSFSHFEI